MSTLAAPAHRMLNDAQLTDFQENGFLIFRGLFTPQEATALRDAFMAQNAKGPVEGLSEIRRNKTGAYSPDDPLAFYPRMMQPHRHPELPVGPLAMRYMLDPRVHRVLCDLFGEEPAAVQSMFYFKPPGARGQDLHQDNFYLRVKPGTCTAAWVAVDDADPDNGGMVVVPGSNKLEIFCPQAADLATSFTTEHVPVPPGLRAEPVNLKAGDCLFFNGSVIHGSAPNTSKTRFRRAFICHYVPASSAELSKWYSDPRRFDGTLIQINEAQGGGPCGTVQESIERPH